MWTYLFRQCLAVNVLTISTCKTGLYFEYSKEHCAGYLCLTLLPEYKQLYILCRPIQRKWCQTQGSQQVGSAHM